MSTQRRDPLALGGVFEEAAELIRSTFWEDEWQREMLRQQMVTNQLLTQIAANTGQIPDLQPPEDGNDGIVYPPPDGDSDDAAEPQRDEPIYWVTAESKTVSNDSKFQSESWPFVAKSLLLFFDQPIQLAFLPPDDRPHRSIQMTADRSPFSIAGVDGLFTDSLYYKKPEDQSENPSLDIIAVK